MASFEYRARDGAGRSQTGTLDAGSPALAVQSLRARGWRVIDVRAASANASAGDLLRQLNPFEHLAPRSIDVELSCKQIAVMLRAGLTLLTALHAVAQQTGRRRLKRAWEHVAGRIQEGSGFAEALREVGVFPLLLVQLARVGEQTGSLDVTIERAAETLEARRNLRTNLMTALAYPTLVLLASIGVTGFMVIGVIPKLRTFLEGMGRTLPAMTQFLVDVSEFATRHLVHGAVGIVVLTLGSFLVYSHHLGRLAVDRGALRVPIIGNLFRLAGTATFSRGLGILVRSGITLLEGLRTVEELLPNRYLAGRVTAARQAVMQGGTLAEPLAEEHAFTPLLSRMVTVGESAGTIDDVLDEVARFHEAQLQSAIRRLSVIIEPLIILVVGGIVGFVYIAFFMALFAAGGA